ncbi:hypothetical protein [Nitrospira sp. Kam-Ns4a]
MRGAESPAVESADMVACSAADCNRPRRLRRAAIAVLAAAALGCGLSPVREITAPPAARSRPTLPAPVVPTLRGAVQPDLDRLVPDQQAQALAALAAGSAFSAQFTIPPVEQTLTDPWAGFAALEARGLRLAELALPPAASIWGLIGALEAGMGRAPTGPVPPLSPAGAHSEDLVASLADLLGEARLWQTRAVRRLSPADRAFLFAHPAALVRDFYPHLMGSDPEAVSRAEADARFCRLVADELDAGALSTAAQALARLADPAWLARAARTFREARTRPSWVGGVSGELVLVRASPAGLIVVGGPGPNRYELDGRIALVLDLGGADTYRGLIAASADADRGVGVVIDLGGDDTYEPAPLGLATGRLGIGLLIDRAGNDVYRLAPGAGGTGFAGLGLLVDWAGDDRYEGSRFTQGAAVGGVGLLLDGAGHDRYESAAYAIGFGGPLGVSAVIDVAGDDVYQCGGREPSSYNATETPGVGPDDPAYQYDCLGLGTGAGQRLYRDERAPRARSLAGGWGVVLDLAGDDRYRSSNFSQGAAYFFGVGLLLDLGGHDEHAAARYGHAAGAHSGVALFVDYAGGDAYRSTGPVYNGGTAWDGSATLAVDAGADDDRYELGRSGGLGQADHRSWGLFIEQGGRDRYAVPIGMGAASDGSLGAFFDLAGEDDYVQVPASAAGRRGNAVTLLERPAGLFLDRREPDRLP